MVQKCTFLLIFIYSFPLFFQWIHQNKSNQITSHSPTEAIINNDNCDNNKTSLSPIPINSTENTDNIDINMTDNTNNTNTNNNQMDNDTPMQNTIEKQEQEPEPEPEQDPDDNFDPMAPCGVCWVSLVLSGDALVYCDGCNVHNGMMFFIIISLH